ncbi:hypothetical protein BJ742DRAFT_745137 [Cladochytrium replicatum]|nr:hypothetical protein BJ742DRAFT_745137 [Cladochytrium replicatum]
MSLVKSMGTRGSGNLLSETPDDFVQRRSILLSRRAAFSITTSFWVVFSGRFSDKLRVMNLLIDDLRLLREFSVRGCREPNFQTVGMVAAVHSNMIQHYWSWTFETIANFKGHNGKGFSLLFQKLVPMMPQQTNSTKLTGKATQIPGRTGSTRPMTANRVEVLTGFAARRAQDLLNIGLVKEMEAKVTAAILY